MQHTVSLQLVIFISFLITLREFITLRKLILRSQIPAISKSIIRFLRLEYRRLISFAPYVNCHLNLH